LVSHSTFSTLHKPPREVESYRVFYFGLFDLILFSHCKSFDVFCRNICVSLRTGLPAHLRTCVPVNQWTCVPVSPVYLCPCKPVYLCTSIAVYQCVSCWIERAFCRSYYFPILESPSDENIKQRLSVLTSLFHSPAYFWGNVPPRLSLISPSSWTRLTLASLAGGTRAEMRASAAHCSANAQRGWSRDNAHTSSSSSSSSSSSTSSSSRGTDFGASHESSQDRDYQDVCLYCALRTCSC